MPADGGAPRVLARYEAGYPSDYNASPPTSRAADAELFSAGAKLRDWARYLAKNSSIVKACLDARQAKGIGPGLRYEPMVRDRKGVLLEKLNDEIRYQHKLWSERADVTGELSRQEIERLVWREWDTAGEVFGRRVYRGRSRDTIGYRVQLIRSELIPFGYWSKEGGSTLGVERDEWGAPVRYWVLPYAPADTLSYFGLSGVEAKPISADDIAHLRRQQEIDQTRGVTLFHSVIFRASDIAEYQQSHRRAARASANLFASINRSLDMTPPEPEASDSPLASAGDLNLTDLQLIDWLKPGEALAFSSPSHPNQNAPEFINQELRQFASACRVAFSWIAYVFDRAYAAQRTELVHAWEMISEDRAHYVRDFAMPLLYRTPLDMMLAEGRLPARELRKADPRSLYDVRVEGPVMPSLDPKTDRMAAQIDEEMGWESRAGNIRRFGRDPVQVDAERAQDTAAPVREPATGAPAAPEPDADEQDPEDNAQ